MAGAPAEAGPARCGAMPGPRPRVQDGQPRSVMGPASESLDVLKGVYSDYDPVGSYSTDGSGPCSPGCCWGPQHGRGVERSQNASSAELLSHRRDERDAHGDRGFRHRSAAMIRMMVCMIYIRNSRVFPAGVRSRRQGLLAAELCQAHARVCRTGSRAQLWVQQASPWMF